jgi:hypothetical protein
LIALIFLFGGLNASSQDSTRIVNRNNSIHVDVATAFYTGMYSINYERKIFEVNNFKMNIDIGVGEWYFTNISDWYSGLSVPFYLTGLIGSNKNFFQIDVGMRYIEFSDKSDKDIYPYFPIFNLGFRFQRPDGKGLIFRSFIGFSGVGIGIGKAF